MTVTETFSLALSILSLVVAGVAAVFTYALSRRQLRLAARHEFQKLLLEVNKEMVRDPELWGIYDLASPGREPHPMSLLNRDDPRHVAKLEAFAYMFLNVIQVVFAYFDDGGAPTPTEEAIWHAWQGTADDLVNHSALVQCLLTRDDADQVFDARFLAWILPLIRNRHEVGAGAGKA